MTCKYIEYLMHVGTRYEYHVIKKVRIEYLDHVLILYVYYIENGFNVTSHRYRIVNFFLPPFPLPPCSTL